MKHPLSTAPGVIPEENENGHKKDGMTLAELQPGEHGIILELRTENPTRRRFLDLGLVPGTEITTVMRSLGGDPIAYFVRGTKLAIRLKDAANIIIKRLD